jgi:hypothetical protein
MIKLFKLLVLLVFITGCSSMEGLETSEATHALIAIGKYSPEISESEVKIFPSLPEFDIVAMGMIEARGMGFTDEQRDKELAMNALIREAAKIGANGVVITSSSQEIMSVSINGKSTEHRIEGIAIRY